jgi:hypothetical protein
LDQLGRRVVAAEGRLELFVHAVERVSRLDVVGELVAARARLQQRHPGREQGGHDEAGDHDPARPLDDPVGDRAEQPGDGVHLSGAESAPKSIDRPAHPAALPDQGAADRDDAEQGDNPERRRERPAVVGRDHLDREPVRVRELLVAVGVVVAEVDRGRVRLWRRAAVDDDRTTLTIAQGPFELRLTEDAYGNFYLIDGEEVCLEVADPLAPDRLFGMLDLRDRGFATRVRDGFEAAWADATVVDEV